MNEQITSVDPTLLQTATDLILKECKKNGKVFIAGNGGSAAIASHVAVDFTKNTPVKAMNFNEADLITCLANDYGYEHWVEKAIELYARKNDVVILISSSGKSKNIINAAFKAREMGLKLITFSGFDANNPLRKTGHMNFWVDSKVYNVVEITHHVWLLAMVDKMVADQ